MDKESIVLGSGDLYCTDFQGTNEAIPDDAVIETEDNRLGHIKGGAEIEYAPEFYEAKDDMPLKGIYQSILHLYRMTN